MSATSESSPQSPAGHRPAPLAARLGGWVARLQSRPWCYPVAHLVDALFGLAVIWLAALYGLDALRTLHEGARTAPSFVEAAPGGRPAMIAVLAISLAAACFRLARASTLPTPPRAASLPRGSRAAAQARSTHGASAGSGPGRSSPRCPRSS